MDSLKKYYEDLYQLHGYSPKSLGWDKGKQFLRFHQLTSDFDLNNASILDVGCGFGDFIKFLQVNQVKNFQYMGVDMMQEFIEEASKQHSSEHIQFIKSDFLNTELPHNFDYAIASGTFNLKIEGVNGYDNIELNMKKMFENCSKAVSIDLLSSRVDYTHEHNFNSDPLKILEMAYGLSKSVILKNNYFPFEFSITIYKDDSFSKESTIFTDVEKALKQLIRN